MIKSFFIVSAYLSILGYSTLFKKFFFNSEYKKVRDFDETLGIILLFFISFLLNFFFPLKYFSSYIFLFGLIIFLFYFKFTFKNINIFIIFCIISLTIIIEPNSLAADTHFYHLQLIKWYSNEKAVFGIANFENRLGLVSGWHHLLSLFNIKFGKTNFLYIVNVIPLLVLLNIFFAKKHKEKIELHEIFLYSVVIFLLMFALIHPVLNGTIFNTLGSADADLAGTLFYIGSFYLFLKYIYEKKSSDFIFLLILVNISYISKISNILLIFLPLYILIIHKVNLKKIKNVVFFLLLLNIFWFSKILISTGCFIFPLEITCFQFDWSLPKNIINLFSNEISAHPRSKNNTEVHYHNYEFYVNSYKWFNSWLIKYFLGISFIQICFLLSIVSLILILIKLKLNDFIKNAKINLFLLAFFVISIYFWLIAPDIRYAYGIFTCLTILLFSCSIKNNKYLNKFVANKNLILVILLTLLLGKNLKYQFSNNIFIENRTFDYSNIYFYKNINNYEIYRPSNGTCNFFEKICVYNDLTNLEIIRTKGYLFISSKDK